MEKEEIVSAGRIPTLHIIGQNIPEAYEKALKIIGSQGREIRTQYDLKDKSGNYIDPPSRDATVMIEVVNPFAQPRIHKSYSDGIGGVSEYIQEVVVGAHDYWMIPNDQIIIAAKAGKLEEFISQEKYKGKWTYTYHQRLFEYPLGDGLTLNQIEAMAQSLAKDGITRRAQAITYVPLIDNQIKDPPCLQRVWARIVEEDGKFYLNMNTEWRSRDLFKAWFENVMALTSLQRDLAKRISEISGKEILIGRYCDKSDSLHIYGSYLKDFEGTMANLEKRPFEERTWDSSTDFIRELFLDDGVGKGLDVMLKREKDKMPPEVWEKVRQNAEDIRQGIIIP